MYVRLAACQPPARADVAARRTVLIGRGLLSDDNFLAYLDYLQYWRQPSYARLLHYPSALWVLEMLTRAPFRAAVLAGNVAYMEDQMQYSYVNARRLS